MSKNIDYALIRDMELIADDLIEWLDLDVIDGLGEFNGRLLRVIGKDSNTIQVSVPLSEFSRWAVSVDEVYDLNIKSERDAFINFVEESRR